MYQWSLFCTVVPPDLLSNRHYRKGIQNDTSLKHINKARQSHASWPIALLVLTHPRFTKQGRPRTLPLRLANFNHIGRYEYGACAFAGLGLLGLLLLLLLLLACVIPQVKLEYSPMSGYLMGRDGTG